MVVVFYVCYTIYTGCVEKSDMNTTKLHGKADQALQERHQGVADHHMVTVKDGWTDWRRRCAGFSLRPTTQGEHGRRDAACIEDNVNTAVNAVNAVAPINHEGPRSMQPIQCIDSVNGNVYDIVHQLQP